jgi:hypothetical protein
MILLQIAATCGVVFIALIVIALFARVFEWESPPYWFKLSWSLAFTGCVVIGVPCLALGLIVRIWS